MKGKLLTLNLRLERRWAKYQKPWYRPFVEYRLYLTGRYRYWLDYMEV